MMTSEIRVGGVAYQVRREPLMPAVDEDGSLQRQDVLVDHDEQVALIDVGVPASLIPEARRMAADRIARACCGDGYHAFPLLPDSPGEAEDGL